MKKHTSFSLLFALCCFSSSVAFAEEGTASKKLKKRPSEMHITRDILQPLGMPIVTGFHKVRESVFLNTQNRQARGFEAVGNFFLAPSRYLFCGKTFTLLDEKTLAYEVRSSFQYKRLHWLKTTLAIIALPITEILGATFKGLAYLSPSVKKENRRYTESLSLVRSGIRESFSRQTGLTELYSDLSIPCQHHARPSQLTSRQEIEVNALKEITKILDQKGIVYWIDCGTALGAYRYGGFIPWDWDIDLSILMEDHLAVKAALQELDPDEYQIQDWSSYSCPNSFLKLYVKKTKNFIDIYHYKIDPENKELFFFFTYQDSPFPHSWKADELKCTKPVPYGTIFPLKKALFDGVPVFAPNDIISFLQSKYGENLDPSNVWDEESQSYKKVLDHPYWKN